MVSLGMLKRPELRRRPTIALGNVDSLVMESVDGDSTVMRPLIEYSSSLDSNPCVCGEARFPFVPNIIKLHCLPARS